jgi:hypothetical protein
MSVLEILPMAIDLGSLLYVLAQLATMLEEGPLGVQVLHCNSVLVIDDVLDDPCVLPGIDPGALSHCSWSWARNANESKVPLNEPKNP